MNNDKRIIDIICDSLLPLAFLFLVIICIIICFTVPVHAADTINGLPYYVNAGYSDYFHLTSEQLNLITSYTSTSSDNLFWLGEPYSYSSSYWGVYLFGLNTSDVNTFTLQNSSLNSNVDYGLFDVDNNFVVVSRTGGTYIKKIIRINKTTGEWSFSNTSSFPSVRDVNLLHLSTKTINEYGYTPNVPFLFQDTQPIYFQGDLNKPIFLNGSPVPSEPEDDNITSDISKPSWNDYTVDWSTGKPTFDTDHPFDSLFSIMSWSFEKLADTFTGGFNFLVDSLNWSLQIFLNNVRAKFQLVIDKVNDFKDLVDDSFQTVNGFLSDIKDSFDYLLEPIDITEIDTAFHGSIMYNLSSIGGTLKNTFSNFFDSIPQPDTLSFSIPYTILSKSGYITVDFSWYPSVRSSVLPWIVGFLYAGFGLAVFRSIPSIIHGVSGVLQKGG